jgi:PTS system nitrogen regulatory IIA component
MLSLYNLSWIPIMTVMKPFTFRVNLSDSESGADRIRLHPAWPFGRIEVETIESVEKYDAIRELISKSRAFSGFSDREILQDAVIGRERLMSTGIGHGVAVAHGKTRAAKKTTVALGISRKGIPFDAPDGMPVTFLFIVANSPVMHDEYMSILSAIARVSWDEAFRAGLLRKDRIRERGSIITEALSASAWCRRRLSFQ